MDLETHCNNHYIYKMTGNEHFYSLSSKLEPSSKCYATLEHNWYKPFT